VAEHLADDRQAHAARRRDAGEDVAQTMQALVVETDRGTNSPSRVFVFG
jgi:hypothetical protein